MHARVINTVYISRVNARQSNAQSRSQVVNAIADGLYDQISPFLPQTNHISLQQYSLPPWKHALLSLHTRADTNHYHLGKQRTPFSRDIAILLTVCGVKLNPGRTSTSPIINLPSKKIILASVLPNRTILSVKPKSAAPK